MIFFDPEKFSQLQVVEDVDGEEIIPIVQGGDNVAVKIKDLPAGGDVASVNDKTGTVVLDTDDIGEGVANLYYTSARFDTAFGGASLTNLGSKSYTDLDDLPTLYSSTDFDSDLSSKTTDDLSDTATNRYTNDTDITRLANTSGTNTGDQDFTPQIENSLRHPGFVPIKSALQQSKTEGGKARIVCFGDSLTRWGTWQPLENTLASVYNSQAVHASAGHKYFTENINFQVASSQTWKGWDASQGTNLINTANVGPGSTSTELTSGNSIRTTFIGDGVSIYYGSAGGGGTFNVTIDGVSAVASHDTSTGYVWKSNKLAYGVHEVVVTANSTVNLWFSYLHSGNHDSGVEIYNLGRGGWSTQDLLDHPINFAFIESLQPDMIIMGHSTNDGNANNYNTRTRALIQELDEVMTVPHTRLIWFPWESLTRPWWVDSEAFAQEIAKEFNYPILNTFAQVGAILGRTDLTPDDVHPSQTLMNIVSESARPLLTPETSEPLVTRESPTNIISFHSGIIRPEDNNGSVITYSAGPVNIVIPRGLPVGFSCIIARGVGTTVLTPSAGTTLLTNDNKRELVVATPIELKQVFLDTWAVVGELEGLAYSNAEITDIGWEALGIADDLSAVGNGNLVETWTDKTGNSHSPTQATSGSRPTYRSSTATMNGQPTVDFSTGDKFLRDTTLSIAGDYSVWAVVSYNSNQTISRILGLDSGNAARGHGTSSNAPNYGNAISNSQPYHRFMINTPTLVRYTVISGTGYLFVNEVLVATGSAFSVDQISLGAGYTSSATQFFSGHIGAWGVIDKDIKTDPLYYWWLEYLKVKYDLPIIHPNTTKDIFWRN